MQEVVGGLAGLLAEHDWLGLGWVWLGPGSICYALLVAGGWAAVWCVASDGNRSWASTHLCCIF